MQGDLRAARLVRFLRAGLLLIAAFSLLSLTLELVFLRHWGETRTIVWLGIAALASSLGLLVVRPDRTRVRVGQGLALAACFVALVGLGFHLSENLNAGPLDRNYADRWDSMSQVEQLIAAGTGDVGPAPTLAPGALAQIGALLLLASIGHPGLKRDEPPVRDEQPVVAT